MSEYISEDKDSAEELMSEAEGAVLEAADPAEAADGTFEIADAFSPDADPPVRTKSKNRIIASVIGGLVLLAAAVLGGYFVCYKKVVIPAKQYIAAVGLYEEGHYEDAISAFSELGNYEDSDFLKASAKKQLKLATAYQSAESLLSDGRYQDACDAFAAISGFSDAARRATDINEEYLTLAGQIRHAKIGDVLDLYDSNDDVIEAINWKVVAREDDRILLCEEYSSDELAMEYDAESMAGYWALDNGNIESTTCLSKEISPMIREQGCFIPTVDFYKKYLAGNSSFAPADGKAWIVTKGEPISAFTDETCTIRFNLYQVTYVGADGKVEGAMPGDNLLFRYFVWLSTEPTQA